MSALTDFLQEEADQCGFFIIAALLQKGCITLSLFFTAMLVGYSGAMMPGPLLTYCIEQSLKSGWKQGLLVPIGHILIEICLVMCIVMGFGRFLERELVQIILLLVGGILLLWFGFDMLRGAVKNQPAEVITSSGDAARSPRGTVLVKSAAISAINPYFLIWWASIGLGFLVSESAVSLQNVVTFYLGHAAADLSWYLAVALLCDKISHFMGGNIYRAVICGLGALLVFFAVRFIFGALVLVGVV